MRHPFYFTRLPNYDSRLKPSGSSRWSQGFSHAFGFARLDSVSLLFASNLGDFSSLQYRYVCGWNMRYKCFHLFMDSEPDFSYICATNSPASLCAPRPTLSSEDLFTSASETCMHHGAIRCCYLISLRTKMNRGVSLWHISVCFDYNIQVLWLTSNRCWADVGGRHQPNVEATLGRHRTAGVDPTSAQHMFPSSFFFTWFILTHWGPDKMDAIFPDDIFKCVFLNANIWILIKFSEKFVCKGPINNIYQCWFR